MEFRRLPGLTPYEAGRELQLELVERRARDEIPDTVLLLEHEPVVTRGRGLQFTGVTRERHMPLGGLPPGVAFAESERGGDLTYHGPGQLVVYPICKLGPGGEFAPERDVAAFLRRFEGAVGAVVESLGGPGVRAFAREGATGVWVEREDTPARKIASMGIAVRRWVTYHGLAINCVNDLGAFRLISPCGFAPEVMTRLADWVPAGSEAAREFARWDHGGRGWFERQIELSLTPVTRRGSLREPCAFVSSARAVN